MKEHSNPFAVITGASRGIGAAYAKALAARGYDLLLVARDRPRLAALADEIGKQHGVAVDVEAMNLADRDAAERLFVAARQRAASVSLLVNNAGFGLFGRFIDHPMPRIQEMLRLHLDTVVGATRLFLPGMLERRSGSIVVVASTAGFLAVPYMAEYAATKAFLISFTRALAEEVAPFGVRLQVCCPGSTETDFHRTAGFRPDHPLGARTAEEVAAASLRGLQRGRVVVTVGWQGGLLRAGTGVLPAGWLTRWAGRWLGAGLEADRRTRAGRVGP
ncbi:SDR family NAD(P)-dependent oxidoreductase [Candidatus Nitrospira bockiana]